MMLTVSNRLKPGYENDIKDKSLHQQSIHLFTSYITYKHEYNHKYIHTGLI